MALLESSGFELIVNPNDSAIARDWVLKHVADPEVHGIIIMPSQPNDKVDQEFLQACNPNLKVISTFSVGFGMSLSPVLCDRSYDELRRRHNTDIS